MHLCLPVFYVLCPFYAFCSLTLLLQAGVNSCMFTLSNLSLFLGVWRILFIPPCPQQCPSSLCSRSPWLGAASCRIRQCCCGSPCLCLSSREDPAAAAPLAELHSAFLNSVITSLSLSFLPVLRITNCSLLCRFLAIIPRITPCLQPLQQLSLGKYQLQKSCWCPFPALF